MVKNKSFYPGKPISQSSSHPIITTHPAILPSCLDQFHREAQKGICANGRYRCSYYTWGNGPPLLFIPGLCDDSLSFVLTIFFLKDFFRCIAYDFPTGQGDGAHLARYRHQDYVDDMYALLDHLKIERCYLFGSSFGSTMTLRALHERPLRFPRAVIQGGFAKRPLAFGEVVLATFARYWPWPMRFLPLRTEALTVSHQGPFRHREPAIWDYFLERVGAPPMAAVARRALILHQVDLRPLLPAIRQPVFMICGDGDPLVGKDCEAGLIQGLPHVTRAEIENCGHLPHYTHPELMAELMLRFLTPVSCPH